MLSAWLAGWLCTVHDTENLTFSADDRAENPHISARTISGFCAEQLASSIPIMIFRTILAACFSIVQRCCARSSPSGFRHFQTESARKIRARLRGRSAPARTEDPRSPVRKFRGACTEVPRHPRGNSAAPVWKIRVVPRGTTTKFLGKS